jgi:hypothetical protein
VKEFLKHDGVPWNNNNAEHAVKAFATLRRVIKGVTSEPGLRNYLVLLSICETCNYQGLDFLDFSVQARQTSRSLRIRATKDCRWRNPGLINLGDRRMIKQVRRSDAQTSETR